MYNRGEEADAFGRACWLASTDTDRGHQERASTDTRGHQRQKDNEVRAGWRRVTNGEAGREEKGNEGGERRG
jgi:hypothetical protein